MLIVIVHNESVDSIKTANTTVLCHVTDGRFNSVAAITFELQNNDNVGHVILSLQYIKRGIACDNWFLVDNSFMIIYGQGPNSSFN